MSLLTLKPNDCVPNTSHHIPSENRGQRHRDGHSSPCFTAQRVASKRALGQRGLTWQCSWRVWGGLPLYQKNQGCQNQLLRIFWVGRALFATILPGTMGHKEEPQHLWQSQAPTSAPKRDGLPSHRAGLRVRPIGLSHISPPSTRLPAPGGMLGWGSPCAPRLTLLPVPCLSPWEAPLPVGPGLERGR